MSRRLGVLLSRALAAGLLLVAGCRSGEAPSPSSDGGWKRVGALSMPQQAMAAVGEAARTSLAQGLMGALTTATAGENFVGGIDACRTQAPDIARQLQTTEGGFSVRVGRTSEKLRNPSNEGPAWVKAALSTPDPAGHWSNGPSIGTLTPIRMAPLCVNCHGPEDALAPGVSEALATHYPSDRATGFAEGDLRGWFWVEVTAR